MCIARCVYLLPLMSSNKRTRDEIPELPDVLQDLILSYLPDEDKLAAFRLHQDEQLIAWFERKAHVDRINHEIVLRALARACSTNEIENAKSIVNRFPITREDILSETWDSYGVFVAACILISKNVDYNLPSVEWLYNHFHLTVEDCRRRHCMPFRLACMSGNVAVAEWFIDQINITRDDALVCLKGSMRYAQLPKPLEIKQSLMTRFNITEDDVNNRHRSKHMKRK